MVEPALSSSDAPTAVRLRGVTKVYDNGTVALGPLDLDIRKGEFVSLLGSSGCGKSTALRLIAGLIAPSAGTLDVAAHSSGHAIGFVFQEPTLMPWSTIRENVRLPLKLAHMPDAQSTRAGGRGARTGRSRGLRRSLSARIIGRHEDARVAGPRAGD